MTPTSILRSSLRAATALVLAACGGRSVAPVAPLALALPDSTVILDPATGAAIDPPTLLRRLAAADFVLLGELHDNAAHHEARSALISALGDRRPAVVFEHFKASDEPIPPPAAGPTPESWLDEHGFDRLGWKWPLHQPVVDAAIVYGRALWGSNVSREALRAVVRDGDAGAPEPLQRLMRQTPLDSSARAGLDRELIDGHCGKLPEAMIPGMRAAQVVRDAAMTRSLLLASRTGAAWLVAGNGHVRRDIAVPRLLRSAAPGRTILVVGLLEWGPDGAEAGKDAADRYDLVIVTPKATRTDPCAGL